MKKIKLNCETANYDILIGASVLAKLGTYLKGYAPKTKVLVVTNKVVGKYFLSSVVSSLKKKRFDVYSYKTPYGTERDKSKEGLQALWAQMAKIPLERGSVVVALGGGVIGDLTGFAAATYMRGIAVVQIPTTLLAQVDSAIGGKTAIDLPIAKNIIGAFHQPKLVLSDAITLKTLLHSRIGREHLRDSFAEVIKYGVIQDTVLFKSLEVSAASFVARVQSQKFLPADLRFLEEVIWRSSKVKADVVSKDEFETKGKRVMLNLGHTFAHGFEAASNYRLSHGRAVAIGIACAARLAGKLKMLKASDGNRIIHLIEQFGLPSSIKGLRLSLPVVMRAMARDKKKKAGKLRFVLPTKVGKTVVKEGVSPKLIKWAIQSS